MRILLLLLSFASYGQVWEKMPKVDDNHYPVFTYSIQSYVQLPGDSLEYKKIGIYVQLLPKVEHEGKKRSEQTRAQNDHIIGTRAKKYYLGEYLKPTGRKFKNLTSEAVQNKELTMMDKMLNSENNFER